MCRKIFVEVIKSLTQLDEVMFPHLDSMGLGFGLNIFWTWQAVCVDLI